MKHNEIANMYNNENLSLKDIAEKLGSSRSTVQRCLVNNGWYYDKSSKKYVLNETNNIANNDLRETIETTENGSHETVKSNVSRETLDFNNNVSHETIVSHETVVRTYSIPKNLDKALKIKCAIEDKNAVDVVREALLKYVEDKYFKF